MRKKSTTEQPKEVKEKFSEVTDETKDMFNALLKKMNQPFSLKFSLINNSKLKTAVKVQKVSDIYQYISNFDVIVFFNEDIFDKLDNGAKEILLLQELDKISVNIDSGKIKFLKPDMVTFSGILKKYGLEKVARANQLNELVNEGNNLAAEAETFFEKAV
jgi:hypothetical protein